MTERWRKRLSDLDQVTPSEDVFHRAHDGPQMPDEMIPRPSTGTRVVTGIAAFVVFALAISVFAIPALRMNQQAGSPSGVGLLPLWPTRSLDELEALQTRADDGDPDAAWATDPAAAAERFGKEVMGWSAVSVVAEVVGQEVVDEAYGGNATAGGGFVMWGSPSMPYPSGYPTGGYEQTTSPPSPYRTFVIGRCEKGCFGDLTSVTFYQPLDGGDGAVWAVLEVSGPGTWFNVETGQAIDEGSGIKGAADVQAGGTATFGFRVGVGACDVRDTLSGNAPVWNETRHIGVDLTEAEEMGCADIEAGYVWLGVGDPVTSGEVIPPVDPFDPDADVLLASLSAVPVTFVREDSLASLSTPPHTEGVTPPPTVGPTTTPSPWSTEQALGLTIDLPNDWSVSGGQGSWEVAAPSGLPYLQIGVNDAAPPEDDSSFPLVLDQPPRDGGSASFRGDGRQFFMVTRGTDRDGELTTEEWSVVQRIIASIRFENWLFGDTRNGWTALHPRGVVTWDWLGDGSSGGVYVLFDSADGPRIFGPTVSCDFDGGSVEGESMTHDADGNAVIDCPDNTKIVWDSNGQPVASGPGAPTNPPLDEHPVVVAHDGTLIAALELLSAELA
ncbi:MAG: hypothetical protein WD096_03185 [Actinomycetota bacterium]